MFYGILLAILTGLCWTSFGIILSFTARKKLDVILFGIIQNFCCMVLALIFFVKWQNFSWAAAIPILPYVLTAGILNATGQYITKCAMQYGHNGLAWAISQSSMVIPFITGVLFFQQKSSLWQYAGVILMLATILLPNLTVKRQNGKWLTASLTAFMIFGIVQTLYLILSLRGISDPINLRPALAAMGMIVGWSGISAITRHRFEVQKSLIFTGGTMSLISITSLVLFFLTLDKLSQLQLGNIAIPLMIGSNICAFTLYSIFTIREKNSWKEYLTVAALLLGLVLMTVS